MSAMTWFVTVGVLLLSLAFLTPLLRPLPLSISTVYLAVGVVLGPYMLGMLSWDIIADAALFEHVTEIAVIVSLFTVGLNMRRSLTDRSWLLPMRLATVTMVLTIAAVAAVGVLALDLSIGAAVLLGALLAPTDPVLASDVQMQDATDQDTLRSSVSGEAGLNDGSAFPFVMLGLGLLGLHPAEPSGLFGLWEAGSWSVPLWLLWDVAWAVVAGLGIGALGGFVVGRMAMALHRRFPESFSLHEFLVLGLIALAYGAAEFAYGYGFLAVFAAGYALRYIELRASDHAPEPADLSNANGGDDEAVKEIVAEPKKAAQFLAASLLDFNDKLEHILAAGVVVLVGSVLTLERWAPEVLWLAPLLFLVIRPLAVTIGVAGMRTTRLQRGLIGWFGIRGIGSIYYLAYAITHELADADAERLVSIVLSLITVSVVVHGVSVTPLMGWYERIKPRREAEESHA